MQLIKKGNGQVCVERWQEMKLAIPLLLGLGLDEFSMSATSILKARSQILHLSKKEMEDLAEKALQMSTTDEVIEAVKEVIEK